MGAQWSVWGVNQFDVVPKSLTNAVVHQQLSMRLAMEVAAAAYCVLAERGGAMDAWAEPLGVFLLRSLVKPSWRHSMGRLVQGS